MKPKFKPSWEIYNRIIWDAQLNEKVFSIGYVDRVSKDGIREKPLVEWDDSEIPWNRVQYFYCAQTIVWDRTERIDLFSTDELPAIAHKPLTLGNRAANFFPKPIFYHANGGWQAYTPAISQESVSDLKIATFNILSNRREEAVVRLGERLPFILQALEACDADILLLQEVESSFLNALLSEAWVKKRYSSERRSASSHQFHRTVILSKWPFSLMEYIFSPQKKFPIATWAFNQSNFHLVGVHLSSNYAEDASLLREEQLTACIHFVETLGGAYAIVGDFNMRQEEADAFFKKKKLHDLWLRLRPDELGYTFEPAKNFLAAEATLTGLPARFDRIVFNELSQWQPVAIDLFANQPIEALNLFLSDHYGLSATLKWKIPTNFTEELQTIQPSYHSALVLIPPQNVWAPIQSLRQRYDSKVQRWMPHLTLLYGFLPDIYFEQAAAAISQALTSIEPFSMTLSQSAYFTQRRTYTAWLKPDAEATEHLQDLQQLLFALFPQCREQSDKANGFTPHLTIGQFSSIADMEASLPDWEALTFPVDAIALISRTKDQPFKIRAQIALKTGVITKIEQSRSSSYALRTLLHQIAPPPNAAQQEMQAFVISLVQEVCDEVLGNHAPLQLYGSALLGTNSAQSDVDLLSLTPLAPPEFLHAVYEQIEPICDVARLILDARTPLLKLTIEGIALDLQAAYHANFPLAITTITEGDSYQFDAASWLAISGYLEGHKVQRLLQSHLPRALFQSFIRLVRAWAKARLIYGHNWGFLGGYAWTILAAWAAQRYSPTHPTPQLTELVASFFKQLKKYDWEAPISITTDGADYKRHPLKDKMPILTTIKPYYNSATNVTTSTYQTIQSELRRAVKIVASIQNESLDWSALLAPPDLTAELPQHLLLQLKGPADAPIEQCCAWISANMIKWLIAFERDTQAFVRPSTQFTYSKRCASTTIGLRLPEKGTLDFNSILQDFDNWPERPPDCTLAIFLNES